MSFLRNGRSIVRWDLRLGAEQPTAPLRASHRLDESQLGYSSASCSPAELASASPAEFIFTRSGGNCKPGPIQSGWIFDRSYAEISAGVDEAFNRNLSAEFGPRGVRSVCIRPPGLPETHTIDVVFGLHADVMGITREQFQGFVESLTHTKRSTRVDEVANAAVWLASDQAPVITGTVLNLTGGLIVD